MAKIVCPNCTGVFDPKHHLVTAGAIVAGAAAGAWVGSGVGIVAGPAGGMAGTIPGAIFGGTLAALGITKFAKCPTCKKVVKV